MTLEECTALLAETAIALRVQIDAPTFRVYHKHLADVPHAVAEAAIAELSRAGMRFFPSATEIRAASEKTRRQQLALNPWSACAECETQPGWRTITDARGDSRVERCPCKKRHQERLSGLGLLEPIAALPGEVERESEQVYPTVQQLPADIRKQLESVSSRKVLR